MRNTNIFGLPNTNFTTLTPQINVMTGLPNWPTSPRYDRECSLGRIYQNSSVPAYKRVKCTIKFAVSIKHLIFYNCLNAETRMIQYIV